MRTTLESLQALTEYVDRINDLGVAKERADAALLTMQIFEAARKRTPVAQPLARRRPSASLNPSPQREPDRPKFIRRFFEDAIAFVRKSGNQAATNSGNRGR